MKWSTYTVAIVFEGWSFGRHRERDNGLKDVCEDLWRVYRSSIYNRVILINNGIHEGFHLLKEGKGTVANEVVEAATNSSANQLLGESVLMFAAHRRESWLCCIPGQVMKKAFYKPLLIFS